MDYKNQKPPAEGGGVRERCVIIFLRLLNVSPVPSIR